MKTITIHIIDKGSSQTLSETVRIDGRSMESIKKQVDEMFDNVPFRKWYYEVESFDDFSSDEELILEGLGLDVDF
jgi:hypothetical protein